VSCRPSTAKETKEERASRVAALKAHGALQKNIAEKRNILLRMMKREMHQDDQARFREIATSLHEMLTNLRDFKVPESDADFNKLWKTFTPELLTACNKSLSTLTTKIQFDFKRFDGPEAVLAAEREAALAAHTELTARLEKDDRYRTNNQRRSKFGFDISTISRRFSPLIGSLILEHLTGKLPNDPRPASQTAHCHLFSKDEGCNGEYQTVMAKVQEFKRQRKYTRVISDDLDHIISSARYCMCRNNEFHTSCNECTIFSICFQLAEYEHHWTHTLITMRDWTKRIESLMYAGMMLNVDPSLRSFLLTTYIEVHNPDMSPEMKSFLFDAITNPESPHREELIGVLTDYHTLRSSSEEIEVRKPEFNEKFVEWKSWYYTTAYFPPSVTRK
jgi:hypothetical protein